MPDDCIFCRVVTGEIPSRIVREDEDTIAFRDINPQAPTHVLVITRKHIKSLDAAQPADAELLGRLLLASAEVARQESLAVSGYRVVLNTGPAGGQTVDHIHVHVLGGRQMTWPPG